MSEPRSRIRTRDRDAILNSLKAGVVPRRGQHLIQVGRSEEVQALMRDLDRMADGGSAIRMVIGEYGSGKTFFLQLVRSAALEKGLVSMHADLAPDRRLHNTQGLARKLYAELARNVATATNPEGGAMKAVVERFIGSARQAADRSGGNTADVIADRLDHLTEMVGGFAFAQVIQKYWEGYRDGDNELKGNAIRWLRGEYTTKTDARNDLDTRRYIDDDSVYDFLKLFARFVQLAGYSGLLVCLDEMVNLYRISHGVARRNNYEQVLRILNDCLQGGVSYLGFLMGGTPEFLTDSRRGLYSYEALRSRLQENTFADEEYRDLTGPVIRLNNLTAEELYVLLENIRHVQAGGDEEGYLVPNEALRAFMNHCASQVGDRFYRNPRETVKQFTQFLAILDQNPSLDWRELVEEVELEEDRGPEELQPVGAGDEEAGEDRDDELAEFEL